MLCNNTTSKHERFEMKKLLIVAILATGLNADMCMFHLKNINKNMEQAYHSEGYIKVTYLELSIDSAINAKYACPEKFTDRLTARIQDIEAIKNKLKDEVLEDEI